MKEAFFQKKTKRTFEEYHDNEKSSWKPLEIGKGYSLIGKEKESFPPVGIIPVQKLGIDVAKRQYANPNILFFSNGKLTLSTGLFEPGFDFPEFEPFKTPSTRNGLEIVAAQNFFSCPFPFTRTKDDQTPLFDSLFLNEKEEKVALLGIRKLFFPLEERNETLILVGTGGEMVLDIVKTILGTRTLRVKGNVHVHSSLTLNSIFPFEKRYEEPAMGDYSPVNPWIPKGKQSKGKQPKGKQSKGLDVRPNAVLTSIFRANLIRDSDLFKFQWKEENNPKKRKLPQVRASPKSYLSLQEKNELLMGIHVPSLLCCFQRMDQQKRVHFVDSLFCHVQMQSKQNITTTVEEILSNELGSIVQKMITL
jgi:hypothetical protein